MIKLKFKPEMVKKILSGETVVTRRWCTGKAAELRAGDVVFVAEPYLITDDGNLLYAADWLDKPLESAVWVDAEYMSEEHSRISLKVIEEHIEALGEMDDDDARLEGFDSLDEFIAFWDKCYPGKSFHTMRDEFVVAIRFVVC